MTFRKTWMALLGIALAAPAGHAQEDTVRTRPGMIGITITAEGEAVRVVEVRRASPAEGAGVREGDVVVTVNGHPAAQHFPHLTQRLRAGETVRLRLDRDGREEELAVVAAPRPGRVVIRGFEPSRERERRVFVYADSLAGPLQDLTLRIDSLQHRLLRMDSAGFRVRLDSMVRLLADSAGVLMERMPHVQVEVLRASEMAADARERAGIARERAAEARERAMHAAEMRPFFLEVGRRAAGGAELAAMNEGLARYFGGQRTGALVVEVGPGTPAERAGLEPGDVIVGAGGEPVNGPADVRRHLAGRGGSLPLQVIRHGRPRDLTMEWENESHRVIIRGQP